MKNILFIFLCSLSIAHANQEQLSFGLRLQQSWNMYYENGFTLEFTPKNLLNDQLSFGATYVSSRF